jgi:type III pantothenate kinase
VILELDFGNSAGKFRLLENKNIVASGRFEYLELDSFLQKLPANLQRIRAVSVLADDKQKHISQLLEQHTSRPVELVAVQSNVCGVLNGYDDATLLGADRWLAIVAAWQQFNCACMVVDVGSAVTIDWLDDQGRHCGGYIIPGLDLMAEALISGTGKIRIDASLLGLTPGKTTQQAVGHGSVLAITAAINLAESLFEKKLNVAPLVVLTGGGAQQLLTYLPEKTRYQIDLVFEGLAYVLP